MKTYLKYGGLALSAALTLGLFARLFGVNAYGVFLALTALCLFEGGAVAWNHILIEAENEERAVARFGQWFCVLASVLSSGAEIILSSRIWIPPFDVGFATLLIIVGALAVNVIGVIRYEMLDPDNEARHRELDRQAQARRETAKLEDSVIAQSMAKAKSEVRQIAGSISDALAAEMREDVKAYLLASTRNGHNRLPLPVQSNVVHAEAPPAPVLADTSPKGGGRGKGGQSPSPQPPVSQAGQ